MPGCAGQALGTRRLRLTWEIESPFGAAARAPDFSATLRAEMSVADAVVVFQLVSHGQHNDELSAGDFIQCAVPRCLKGDDELAPCVASVGATKEG